MPVIDVTDSADGLRELADYVITLERRITDLREAMKTARAEERREVCEAVGRLFGRVAQMRLQKVLTYKNSRAIKGESVVTKAEQKEIKK